MTSKGDESMNRPGTGMVGACLAVAALLVTQHGLLAQELISVKLDPSGLIQMAAGDAQLATIELSAHGSGWTHAPQVSATAQVSNLPGGSGKRFAGTLPIPNTEGGAIEYTETLRVLPRAMRIVYDVGVRQAIKLNGLHVSVYLPVAGYAGKELVIERPDDDPDVVTLPAEQRGEAFQVWGGEGSKIEIGKGTEQAITVSLLAAADVVIHDLRKWDQQVFEIRFPAIMEDPSRDVTPEDRFHLDISAGFDAPLQLVGP